MRQFWFVFGTHRTFPLRPFAHDPTLCCQLTTQTNDTRFFQAVLLLPLPWPATSENSTLLSFSMIDTCCEEKRLLVRQKQKHCLKSAYEWDNSKKEVSPFFMRSLRFLSRPPSTLHKWNV